MGSKKWLKRKFASAGYQTRNHMLQVRTDTLTNEVPGRVVLNRQILDWSKLKAFANNILNLAEILKFVLGRLEKIEGKGENAGYQHCLLFPESFQKASILGLLKVGIAWYRV